MRNKYFIIIGVLLLAGCTQTTTLDAQPANKLDMAQNSQIVELADGARYDLQAGFVQKEIAGKNVTMMAYNGSIPGPALKVEQGSTIFVNLQNRLDSDTTIHSHGVRLKNAFDGVEPLVKPGENFVYEITFPDPGVYWYHPHVREDYTQELGLYGNFIVTPKDKNYWPAANQESYIFLDDILMDENGVAPFYKDYIDHALMGRFGNVLLINGATSYQTSAETGENNRFIFTNSANVRPFNIKIVDSENEAVDMTLVGGDGGRLAQFKEKNEVLLSPSERAILDVVFEEEGTYKLIHQTPEIAYTLGEIKVSAGQKTELVQAGRVDLDMPDLEPYLSKNPDQSLILNLKKGMGGGADGGHAGHHGGATISGGFSEIEWEDIMGMMNTNSTNLDTEWQLLDEQTGKSNMDIDWEFQQGDFIKIRINNDANSLHPMQHPIHFHGQRFLILSRDGVANDELVWKDTAMLKAGETVDLLVEMSNPGVWMAHCHIAEHLHSGMMLSFTVKE